jgi:hypothetical protein
MRGSKTVTAFSVVALFSFAGGFAGQMFMGSHALASSFGNFFAVQDDKNVKGWNVYVSDGQPGMIFYGENGQMRIQSGTYNSGSERGQPMFSLNDSKGEIKMLLRIAGASDSPVIVMKDNSGRDRLVMGLSFDDKQSPFLNITDENGASQDVFGHYGGHP